MHQSDRERLNNLSDKIIEMAGLVGRLSASLLKNPDEYITNCRSDLLAGRAPEIRPIFGDIRAELDEVDSKLGVIEFGDTWIDVLLKERLAGLIKNARRLHDHSGQATTTRTTELYGEIDEGLVASYEEILGRSAILEERQEAVQPVEGITPGGIAARIEGELRRRGILDWTVELDSSLVARVSITSPLRRIRVNSNEFFEETSVLRLIVHEIDTHVMRYVRGARQDLRLLRYPLEPNLRTEEGLAVFNEARAGLLSAGDLVRYACRAYAAKLAVTCSIVEVYESIVPFVGRAVAARTAIRCKRGMADPMEAGANIKDSIYLGGYRDIEKMNKRPDGRESYLLLHSCKQPISMLPRLRELHRDGDLSVPTEMDLRR